MSSIKTSKIVPLSSALTIDSATTVVAGKLSAGGAAGDTPLAPLQVYGASTSHGAENRGVFLASNTTNSRQVQIGINDSLNIGWIEGWVPGVGGLKLCINPSASYVGIGTTNPAVALDVNGEARSSTSTTSASNAKTLTTKDYVDSLIWTSSATTTIPIGGIVMTGSAPGEGSGVDNGGGGTIATSSMGPGYIIYAITYAANSGNSKYGGRYWIGARTQAQISADTPGGYTGTPTVIYGTFVCRGLGERTGTNVAVFLWQRIA